MIKQVSAAISLGLFTIGVVGYFANSSASEQQVSASENNMVVYESNMEGFEAQYSEDIYTINYRRDIHTAQDLGTEFAKLLGGSDMESEIIINIAGAVGANEVLGMDESNCAAGDTRSPWCFSLTNLEDNEVEVVIKRRVK